MFLFGKEDKEDIKDVKPSTLRPYVEKAIKVNYSLRNGKSYVYTITYYSSDYKNYNTHEEAIAAMDKDIAARKEEIENNICAGLGNETGWIKFGTAYIALRDLAMVNIHVIDYSAD